jgi:F0F1-type ATP synthase assembly protein I
MKMKFFPITTPKRRTDDTVGQGIDIALTVALMFGIGFVLDRWLGTAPIFMITLTLLGAVGFFAKFKYQYDARMEELQAERVERVNAGKADPP